MFETYIFDLYGTLVDIHTDESMKEVWENLALFYGYYGAAYQPEELKLAYESTVAEMQQGKEQLRKDGHEGFPEIQIEQVFQKLFQDKHVDVGREQAVYTGQFFRALSTDYIRLYDGTKEMLERLRMAGKKIYLLSNAQRIFTAYEMKALGIYTYFDGIFISSDFPYKKPDPRFFEELLKEYKIDRDSAIMVGNDGICDIKGAKDAGLHTFYIRSNISPEEELPKADYVLESMDMERVGDMLLAGVD